MTVLLEVTPLQIASLWEDLMMAYYGDHKHGSITAQVYLYRFMPRDPWSELERNSEEAAQAYREANQRLYELCRLFEDRMDVTLTLGEFTSLSRMVDSTMELNRHSWSITVNRPGKTFDWQKRLWVDDAE